MKPNALQGKYMWEAHSPSACTVQHGFQHASALLRVHASSVSILLFSARKFPMQNVKYLLPFQTPGTVCICKHMYICITYMPEHIYVHMYLLYLLLFPASYGIIKLCIHTYNTIHLFQSRM